MIVKGLWSHKRRLFATSSAVVLGVAFLAASLAVGDTLTDGFVGLFGEANAGTDVVVRSELSIGDGDMTQRGRLPIDLGDRLATVDGVADVLPVLEGSGRIVGTDGDALGGNGPPTTATNWIGDSQVNPWQLSDGRAPIDVVDGEPFEIVIDRASAQLGDLAVGDHTVVEMLRPVPVTVVGLATFGGADSLGPTTFAAFTDVAIHTLLDAPGEVSDFRLAAAGGVSQSELQASVEQVLPPDAEALTGAQITDDMVAQIETDFLGMFRTIMVVFALIALVVAAFSIHNTFSILIAQRSRESALLRAVGASRRQVMASVIAEAIVVGVIASAVGLLAGFGLATGFKAFLDASGLDLDADGVLFTSSTMLIAAAVGVFATLVASIVPAIRAARVAPLAALRESAVDGAAVSHARTIAGAVMVAGGAGAVIMATSTASVLTTAGLGAFATIVGAVMLGPAVAGPAVWALGSGPVLLRGQTGRLARRNAMRDPRRTSASASALMVGTAVVALFTTFGASIKATIEQTVDQDFGGDLVVVSDDFSGPGISVALAEEIAALPEVTTSVGLANALLTVDGRPLSPTVTDPTRLDDVLDLDVSSGALDDVTPGQVAISEMYADDNGLEVGSHLAVSFADGVTSELSIAALYGTTANVGDMLMTAADWTPHADQTGDVAVLIDLADGVAESDGRTAVDAIGERYGAPGAQTRSEYIDSVGAEVDQTLYFVYGMLGLAVLIALMGIANTLSLSIHERIRELGVLRAVGQTRSQVRAMVRWESMIIAVFGTVLGVGLGTFLGWGLMRALAQQEGFGVFAVPFGPLGAVLVFAALAGVVAAWRPAHRAARIDVLAAIATD
ncbi:MAG: FtsX-like permease family protein [Ilumatobacteraceae bacterium]